MRGLKKVKILIWGIGLIVLGAFTPVQDGSDIVYYNPADLDESLIGKICHIDFGRISFRGTVIDTIEIEVQGKLMKFYEHRVDNGFSNWFKDQYLLAYPTTEQNSVRLQDSRIDSLTIDKVFVTSILSYYAYNSPLDTITVFQHSYDRDKVAKVLVKK